ncbi:hypothetical protein Vafri_4067, partial [Volvox africanus]
KRGCGGGTARESTERKGTGFGSTTSALPFPDACAGSDDPSTSSGSNSDAILRAVSLKRPRTLSLRFMFVGRARLLVTAAWSDWSSWIRQLALKCDEFMARLRRSSSCSRLGMASGMLVLRLGSPRRGSDGEVVAALAATEPRGR